MREYEIGDLTGKRFGKWTVKTLSIIEGRYRYRWICECLCGTLREVEGNSLRLGKTKSCGCDGKLWLNTKIKYGRLLPIEPIQERAKGGSVKWLFQCDCGKISTHIATRVKDGSITSCGCGRINFNADISYAEIFSDYKFRAKQHGLKFELPSEYFIKLITSSCYYCGFPPNHEYNHYKRRNSKPKHLPNIEIFSIKVNGIDRINNNLGYTKENSVSCCKFCNLAKNRWPVKDFLEWLENLASHSIEAIGRVKFLIQKYELNSKD